MYMLTEHDLARIPVREIDTLRSYLCLDSPDFGNRIPVIKEDSLLRKINLEIFKICTFATLYMCTCAQCMCGPHSVVPCEASMKRKNRQFSVTVFFYRERCSSEVVRRTSTKL